MVKVANCRGFGAEVILEGETFEAAKQRAGELAAERGMIYVPGFDDPDIIAGQGAGNAGRVDQTAGTAATG